jgi:flagellin-like protein
MRNTKKRGISPVIATVILVAIAIVISIAAAFWMTGLLSSFTTYERVQIVSSYAIRSGTSYKVCVNMTNIGATNVTITNILVNDKPYNTYDGLSIKVTVYYDSTSTWYTAPPCPFGPGTRCNIQIDGLSTSNFRPGSTIKVSILTASGITYDRTITLP